MATKLPKSRRSSREQSERAELEVWLANFKPKTKLGRKLLALSKEGLDSGEPLLDSDGVMKELGRRKYQAGG